MLLTDEEIRKVYKNTFGEDFELTGKEWVGAQAVIAAHEAKLREQKPVAWTNECELSYAQLTKANGDLTIGSFWSKYDEGCDVPLFEHPAPIHEGWTAIHLKTGNEYQVIGEAIDATNMHSNQLMVIYQRDGKTFVREAEEFQEKFKAAARSGE